MKKCYAKIEYKNGRNTIEELKLKSGLSFGLKEMEEWIKENPTVKKVKCFIKL